MRSFHARIFTGVSAHLASAAVCLSQPTTVPPPLHNETVTFDQLRNRLVLIGGAVVFDGGYWGDLKATWEWDGQRWSTTEERSGGPSPRSGHGVGYDPVGKRVVVYGGARYDFGGRQQVRLCDTWFFDGRAWANAPGSSCVSNRLGPSLVFDSAKQRLLLVEGSGPARSPLRPARIWRWNERDWVLVDSGGPRRLEGEYAAFDQARSRLVVPVLRGPDAGTWEWDGTRWEKLPAEGPVSRDSYGLTYDPHRRRVVLAGGAASSDNSYLDDVWAWDGAKWTRLATTGTGPTPRMGATLVADVATRSLLYFGGSESSGRPQQQLWRLDSVNRWHLVSAVR
jgi:hypothetical protein